MTAFHISLKALKTTLLVMRNCFHIKIVFTNLSPLIASDCFKCMNNSYYLLLLAIFIILLFILVFTIRNLGGKFNHTLFLNFSGCQPKSRNSDSSNKLNKRWTSENGTPIRYLEHVQVYADIVYERRGLLQLSVISPSGMFFFNNRSLYC